MVIQLKDPIILPKVIPLNTIEDFLATIINKYLKQTHLIKEEMLYVMLLFLKCFFLPESEYPNYVH